MTDLTDEDTPEEIAEERITNLMRELDECKAKLVARSAKSGDWTAEARDRLNRLCALPAKDVPCQADIRAALGEIERRGERLAQWEREEVTRAANCCGQEERAEAAEAKLAEAERIVGLQNAALDVWKGAYPSDDSIHLAALAVAQGDRRLRVALEQIDRETRSASDVGLLRMGSIARAALRGGGE